jgi:uncharacterized protein (TIGR03089 family)
MSARFIVRLVCLTVALPNDTVDGRLRTALINDAARPLVTFYDDATGERVELSVATFDNWVAKTANLLRDGLDVQPGGRVGLLLPLHWQAAVWIVACWAAGAVVVPGSTDTDVIVADASSLGTAADVRGADVVGLSLAPLGAPLQEAPHGVLDYAIEVRGYGDRFEMRPRPAPADPALEVGGRILSQGEMTDVAGLRSGDRLLTTLPVDTIEGVRAAIAAPLAADASVVLCRNLDATWLVRRMAAEHVSAIAGEAQDLPAGVRRVI